MSDRGRKKRARKRPGNNQAGDTSNEQPTSRVLDTIAVVTAAGDLIDEIGPEELSLTRVAEQLGVTQPALYRHVANLAELWRLLGIDTRARLANVLAEASIGLAGGDAIEAIANAWRQFAIDHPGRYASTGRHSVEGEPDLTAAAYRTISVLERALSAYGFDDDARRDAAEMMRSTFHGFASYEIGHGHPDPERLDVSYARLVHHLTVAFDAEKQLHGDDVSADDADTSETDDECGAAT